MYDQNQILDHMDKLLYCHCLLISLLVVMLTIYPVELLLFLVKLTKISYEFIVLYVFLKLTETETAHPKSSKVIAGITLVIVIAALYCKYYLTQKI
jgi:Na+/pantothenate symporter